MTKLRPLPIAVAFACLIIFVVGSVYNKSDMHPKYFLRIVHQSLNPSGLFHALTHAKEYATTLKEKSQINNG